MSSVRGKLITLEGIEGSGKSTFLPLVLSWITAQGHKCIRSREPGGTKIAERIRELLLTPNDEAIDPTSEFLLMAAARKQHLEDVIAPALAAKTWVVLDRFADSSFAYQGYGKGVSTDFIDIVHRKLLGNLVVDLTLWLELDPATSRDRVKSRKHASRASATTNAPIHHSDRFEALGDDFFARAHQGFTRLWREHPERIVRIDATQPLQTVEQQIIQALKAHFCT